MAKLLTDTTASRLAALLASERGAAVAAQEVQRTLFPFGKIWPFGLSIDGMAVTIHNPMLRRMGDPQGSAICYTCSDATVTFGGDGDGQRICWQWSPTAGLSILENAQTNDPLDDSYYRYGVVAIFDVTNSKPRLAVGGAIQAGHMIWLPVFTVAGT